MKKMSFIKLSAILIFFGFFNSVFAQSDLEIVNNFKAEFTSIDKSIKDAASLGDLKDVPTRINALKV